MQIWQNEGGKKYENLVFWNPKEPFPSLGIGHFIWYPTGHIDIYTETFPELLTYLHHKKVKLPPWLTAARGAPWKDYEEFKSAKDDRIEQLRRLLFDTIDLQVDLIIQRLNNSWRHIQKQIAPHKRAAALRHVQALRRTPAGLYALIDYLNFKGEGTNPAERYKEKGWGLLQVLEAMPADVAEEDIVKAFVAAAQKVLSERVANAADHKKPEQQWLQGWHNRIATYLTFAG